MGSRKEGNGQASVSRWGLETGGIGGKAFVIGAKTGWVRTYNQKCQLTENRVQCTQSIKDRRLADEVYHRMEKSSTAVGSCDSHHRRVGAGDTGSGGHQSGRVWGLDCLSAAVDKAGRGAAERAEREVSRRWVCLAGRVGLAAAELDGGSGAQRGTDGAGVSDRTSRMGLGLSVALGDVAVEGAGGGPVWGSSRCIGY